MYCKEIDFNSLTITNDFVFCTAMRRNKRLCMEFIRRILDIKVKDIAYIGTQETMDESIAGKGIRLDVYVEDDANSVYDLEMQTTTDPWLPKRSRYYQSVIDVSTTNKGTGYRDLKRSFVVFICTKDPFTYGRGIYHFEKICREVPELKLDDETETVFVNAAGAREGLSRELANLLDYIAGREKKDTFIEELDRKVVNIVTDQNWRLEYMTLEMRDYENRMKGRDEGLKEGLEQGLEQGRAESDKLMAYLLANNLTAEALKATQDPAYKAELLEKYQSEL